jgi:hypothetical protein
MARDRIPTERLHCHLIQLSIAFEQSSEDVHDIPYGRGQFSLQPQKINLTTTHTTISR